MAPRFSILLYLALGAALPAPAQEELGARPRLPAVSCEDAQLLELLEFLGEFTTEDGLWVDPDDLLAAGDAPLRLGGAVDDEDDEQR